MRVCDTLPVANDGTAIDAEHWPQQVDASADGSGITVTVTNPRTDRRYRQTASADHTGTLTVSEWCAL